MAKIPEMHVRVDERESIGHRQKVVRPPDVSKVDAVVKLHSSLAMKQIIAAVSWISPRRPIGIFDRM